MVVNRCCEIIDLDVNANGFGGKYSLLKDVLSACYLSFGMALDANPVPHSQ